jgi:ribosomal protein S18 acetylase RimI-like enzyme
MSVRLRPATAEDSGLCYRLHRAAMRPYVERVWGWDEAVQAEFHRARFDPARTRIVAVDGRDVGVLIVHDEPDAVYLGRIAVHPRWQGRGIGTGIIRDLLADAAARGRPVTLDVLVVNDRARALYERLGFREVGRHGEGGGKIRMRADPG